MNKPTATQIAIARYLFAAEGGDRSTAEERAAATGRVYEKLLQCLSPIVGAASVRSMIVRTLAVAAVESADLAGLGRAFMQATDAVPPREAVGGESLQAYLRTREPAVVTDTAITMLATFLALLSTLIGEGLTARLLVSAWPAAADVNPSKETKS